MIQTIDANTPIAMLTVGQFKELISICDINLYSKEAKEHTVTKNHVYGIAGLARLFGCSIPTAHRIKASGKIDGAIKQIGRKIIVDADLALELAGKKEGGRK